MGEVGGDGGVCEDLECDTWAGEHAEGELLRGCEEGAGGQEEEVLVYCEGPV